MGQLLAWAVAGTLLAFLLLFAWIGVRGALAYQHLAAVQRDGAASVARLAENPSDAAPTVAALAEHAREARQLTSDWAWTLAEGLPYLGPQLGAFATVSSSADELLGQSLLPLTLAAQNLRLEDLKLAGGRIDTAGLAAIAMPAQEASVHAASSAAAIEQLNRAPLVGLVNRSVDKADELFASSAVAIDSVARAAQVLPRMLGEEGQRNYLIVVQNNAEWRSLGGITGTAILLHTDGGSLSLKSTSSAGEILRDLKEPIVAVPPAIQDVYGTRPARYFHNVTQVPDFTFDGPLARDMYRSRFGLSVDGVIAVDPVVLSYVLSAVGPVDLPTGDSLSGDNAAKLLMNEVYFRYSEPSQQDAFFSMAAASVFEALVAGQGTASSVIAALYRAGEEHRLFVWSADPEEQAILADSTIAGPLPSTDARTARFGVYLNDGTGSKMSYYVAPQTSLAWDSCPSADPLLPRQLTLHLDLTSTAPADAATSLPTYITGNAAYGTAPGTAKVVGNVYLPEGFDLVSAQTTNGASFARATFDGRTVLTFGVDVTPQQTIGVDVVVQGASPATEAEAFVTPTADAALDPVVRASCQSRAVATLE